MATQEQDTFATGGRGAANGVGTLSAGQTITAFSPASNADNWIAQAAPSGFTYNSGTSQGQTTGATPINQITLNGVVGGITKLWYDSLVVGRFQKTAVLDGAGVLARFQNTNNYYRADVQNNVLTITKVVNGANITVASVAFTDGGAKFWVKFQVQGFGLNGTVNNLQAKAWLDGNSEPGFQISGTDGSLTQAGLVGVKLKGSTTGTTQSVDSFLASDPPQFTPAPTYNTLFDLPYGDTLHVGATNPPPLPQQSITDIQGIGNGAWLRWQQQWSTIEMAQGIYNWAILDDAVYRSNQAGIRVWLPIQSPPTWRLTRDGYGNNCTLTMPVQAGVAMTQIAVSALVSGTFIPHGATLSVDYGGANPETVTINNPGNTYKSGVTMLTINSWTPSFAHAVGAQIYESTGGPQLASAADFAIFAGLVAARYNGTAGYGRIECIQIENEAYDATTRIGSQSASWDNGGGILAPVYVAAYNAIKAVYPSCVVMSCAVRKPGLTALAHIQNWLTGFYSGVLALGGQVDAVDAHYYRDNLQDWNGTPAPDPTVNTLVASGGAVNVPNIALELFTLRQYANIYGFSPALNIGEFGWNVCDDGTGATLTTNLTITAGTPITSIQVASIPKNILDSTPIFIDTGGTNPEQVYAWGQTNTSGGSTVVQITTNPAGHAQAQAAWTPGFTHTSPVTCYAALGGLATSQTNDLLYTKAMYDAGLANGAAHMIRFTISSTSTISVASVPQTTANVNSSSHSWAQFMSGVYTYMPGYYLTKLYAQFYMTKVWQAQYSHVLPLTADVGLLPLSSNANPGLIPLAAPTP
jgi:hypothetical protein